MSSQPAIGDVRIEVIADVSEFEESLRQDLVQAFERLEKQAGKTLSEIGKDSNALGQTISRNLARALRFAGEAGEDAGDVINNSFDRARRALVSMQNQLKKSSNAGKRLQTIIDNLDEARKAALELGSTVDAKVIAAFSQLGLIAKENLADIGIESKKVQSDIERTIGKALKELGKDGAQLDDIIGKSLDEIRKKLKELGPLGKVAFDRIVADLKDAGIEAEVVARGMNSISTEMRQLERLHGVFDGIEHQMQDAGHAAERLDGSIKQLAADLLSIGRGASVFRQIGDSARRANPSIDRLQRNLRDVRFAAQDLRFLLGAGLFTFAIGEAIRFGVESNQSFTETRLALAAIAGAIDDTTDSTAQAEAGFQRIADIARSTPLDVREVSNAMRRLVAITPSINLLGDSLSFEGRLRESEEAFTQIADALFLVGNPQGLDSTIKAIGDIGAAGKLTGEEVRQLRNQLTGIDIRESILDGVEALAEDGVPAMADFRDLVLQTAGVTEIADENMGALTSAMVNLQRRGLIPAEVAVEGLLRGLEEFPGAAGAAALFTQTIAGQMEKLREGAALAVDRGFAPLAQVLVDNLEPALGSISEAAESFGQSFSDMVEVGIAPALLVFGELAEVIAEFFDEITSFLEGSGTQLTRFFERLGEAARQLPMEDLFELFLELGDTVVLLIEGLADLMPLLGAMADLLGILNTVLDPLPDSVQALALAWIFLNRAVLAGNVAKALTTFANNNVWALILRGGLADGIKAIGAAFNPKNFKAAGTLTGLGDSIKGLGTVLTGGGTAKISAGLSTITSGLGGITAAGALVVTAAASVAGAFDGIGRASDRLEGEMKDLRDTILKEGGDAFDVAAQSSKTLGDQLADAEDKIDGVGDRLRLAIGVMTPFSTEAERAAQEVEGLNSQLQHAGTTGLMAAKAMRSLETAIANAFGEGDPEMIQAIIDQLTSAELGELGRQLGITFSSSGEAVTTFNSKTAEAKTILEGMGIELGEIDASALNESAAAADALEDNLRAATAALKEQVDAQRAMIDPAFAAIDAQQALDEAISNIGTDDAVSDLDLVKLQLDLDTALGELAATGEGFGGAVNALQTQLAGVEGPVADALTAVTGQFETTGAELADRAGQLAENLQVDFAEAMPAVIESGITPTLVAMDDLGIQSGAKLDELAVELRARAMAIGKAIAEGMAAGIDGNNSEVENAADRAAVRTLDSFANRFETASPSKATERIGGYVAEGLAQGISSMTSSAVKAAAGMAGAVTHTLEQITVPDLQMGSPSISLPTTDPISAELVGKAAQVSNSNTSTTRIVEMPMTINEARSGRGAGKDVSERVATRLGL